MGQIEARLLLRLVAHPFVVVEGFPGRDPRNLLTLLTLLLTQRPTGPSGKQVSH
jgi:hypothetical protein